MYGVRSFYKMMKKYGIHPVIGLSVTIDIGEGRSLSFSMFMQKMMKDIVILLKMSSAISVRESEILPLQWLAAYSAGCILIMSND